MNISRGHALGSLYLAVGLTVALGSLAPRLSEAAPPGSGDTPSVLQPYLAPDRSASAGVPSGWHVTKGQFGVIQMSGPRGEMISLGNGLYVRNGGFQAGQRANGPITMSMPYDAPLQQKYAMLWQQAAATQGQQMPQIRILSARPIQMGAHIAQCGVFIGEVTDAKGRSKFESQFCSLPLDSGGIFKLFWTNATIPLNLAAEEFPLAEAVLASYRPSRESIKLILAPVTPRQIVRPSGGGAMNPGTSSAINGAIGADHSAECMDLGVIREVPEWKLPSYCH